MDNFKKTQILVLGSTHLGPLGDKFHPRLLDNLIEILKRFKPDLICVENLSGEVIERMLRGGDEATAQQFASSHIRFAKRAQKIVGMTRVEAEHHAKKLPHKKLTTQKRLELILTFLAAYDSNSAALQWSYLPQKVRETTEKIPKDIRVFLDKSLTRANEVMSIGARLAREFNLQMLVAVDDHPAFDTYPYSSEEYGEAIGEGYKLVNETHESFYEEFEEREKKALGRGDLLPYYRYINSPKACKMFEEAECHNFLRTKHPAGLDRARIAEWEVRNLVMTAYIRKASAMVAGKRILMIVGCSHKPLFDRYLKQLTDIEIVQLREIEARETNAIKQAEKNYARGHVTKESAKAHFKRLNI
jgi:Family of unknown function (DUF5694)